MWRKWSSWGRDLFRPRRSKNKFALLKPRFQEGELRRQRLLESLVEFACDNLLRH